MPACIFADTEWVNFAQNLALCSCVWLGGREGSWRSLSHQLARQGCPLSKPPFVWWTLEATAFAERKVDLAQEKNCGANIRTPIDSWQAASNRSASQPFIQQSPPFSCLPLAQEWGGGWAVDEKRLGGLFFQEASPPRGGLSPSAVSAPRGGGGRAVPLVDPVCEVV